MKKVFLKSTLLLCALVVGSLSVWGRLPNNPKWVATSLSSISDGATIIIISNSTQATNIALPSTTTTTNPAKKACTISTTDGKSTITPPTGTTLQDLAWTLKKVKVKIDDVDTDAYQLYQEGSNSIRLYLTGLSSNTALRVGDATSSNDNYILGNSSKLLKVTTGSRYVGPNDQNGTDWRTYNSETASNYKGATLTFYVMQVEEVNYWVATYDYNDGLTADKDVEVDKTTEASSYVLEAAPTRLHFDFIGWNDGTNNYDAGAAYPLTSDKTFTAQWDWDGTSTTYNKSSKSDLATGAQYILVGGSQYAKPSALTSGSQFFTSADKSNNNSSITSTTASLIDEIPLVLTLEETDGGWYLKNSSSKKLGMSGDKQMSWDSGDVTWELGGTNDAPTFSAINNNKTYILKYNSGATRFNGYESGQAVAYFYRLDDGKDVYTLLLDFNDGATDDAEHRVLEGADYTLTAPTRSGYAFNGWNTEENGTGTSYPAGAYTMPDDDVILYAQWVSTAVTPSSETGKHYATYNAPYKTKLDAGVKAYIGTYSEPTLTLHVLEDSETGTVIPANTPVVLKATSSAAFNVVATTDEASEVQDGTLLTANNLHGTLAATTAPANAYVLGYNSAASQETGFYQFSGTIPANRAYLIIDGGAVQAAGIRIVESENNATDIKSINANENVVKFIENGQLLILRDGITYDALGRVVR